MNYKMWMTVCAFSVVPLAFAAPVEDPNLAFPFLASLTIAVDELPLGCKVQQIPDDDPRLNGVKNREINTSPKFFTVGDEDLKELANVKLIKASYYAIYCEKDECGIVAWAFASEKAAKDAYNTLRNIHAEELDVLKLYWQKNEYVVGLWRDPGTTDACFEHIERIIESKINSKPVARTSRVAEPPADPKRAFPWLASLILSKDELPAGCKLLPVPARKQAFMGSTNYTVNTNPEFFAIGKGRLQELIDLKRVRASYFGSYYERDEVGIIAWAFETEADAMNAKRALVESYAKEPDRFRFWQVEQFVVWLWRDFHTTDACFEHFTRFIESKVNQPAKEGKDTASVPVSSNAGQVQAVEP